MDSSRAELLLGPLFDPQDDLFHPQGFPGADPAAFPLSEGHGFPAEKLYDEWQLSGRTGLSEREDADDYLQMMINPNDVYSAEAAASESPESDSGFSDDPRPETPMSHENAAPLSAPPVYELVYDIGAMEERKVHGEMSSVISIQLAEDWPSPVLIPESCIVNDLPSLHAGLCKPLLMRGSSPDLLSMDSLYPELHLTDEEKRLLSQEGVALPNNLPLTKAEERILKKVRRKIRNKQSAQDSRRRKKEYIDGLESRVAACSAQNQELHKKVLELEKHNISLITQLRKLQTLIKQTSNKAAQTGTCVLILFFSLALLIYPNYYPLRSGAAASDKATYTPTGVISRNILNTGGFSEVTEAPLLSDRPTPELQLEEKVRDASSGTPRPPEQEEAGSENRGPAPEELVPLESPPPGQKDILQFHRRGGSAGKDPSKTVRSDEI
ncbi:cyclic AMP-responsive element-binding protein 3-like protein 4 isoform X4 [Rana temporaria]|uniref:cyclic AMP-responsive element-binding protein 3-like protein 4 isoform X4 n=1 Tax=Rana temporaria TaxID=8407 RepID=UPI001AAC5034|nr:cyclic AMP-responsive element-binding protein 3-like protein 4 isoform X4 [Rana temporaria]